MVLKYLPKYQTISEQLGQWLGEYFVKCGTIL